MMENDGTESLGSRSSAVVRKGKKVASFRHLPFDFLPFSSGTQTPKVGVYGHETGNGKRWLGESSNQE